MLPLQDREHVGHKIPQTGRTANQSKAIDVLEEIPLERNTKEDLHCTPSMHNVQKKPTGTSNLATEQDTVPMLSQILQVCFDGSLSNNWRC